MENLNGVKSSAATMAQNSFVFLKSNWMSIVAVILLGVLGYYMYNHFFVNSTLYNVNRENLENNENSNKTANLMLFFVCFLVGFIDQFIMVFFLCKTIVLFNGSFSKSIKKYIIISLQNF